ncbi:response regulator [uncultured Phenylobacterium sp.]|uniref:response regulator transcription factor n=1 Tax=uncultured Phenylobacterium sp. TaxID=349273 RepID=UPI0025F6411B|nr:response regulator [uncultured Phenylobacterium sp.]
MPTVLIIEDDASLRAVIASTFTRMGYRTRVGEDGAAGLALFATEPADLVITDIYMPRMDGIEVIMALRRQARVPAIIAMSESGRGCAPDLLNAATVLGADAALRKPLSVSALLRLGGELLEARATEAARRRGMQFVREAAA